MAAEAAPALMSSRSRKLSLASQMASVSPSDAFLHAIAEGRPEVAATRMILKKPPGKRTLDDIFVLKSLLASSKLLEFFSNLDTYKVDKLYQSIELGVYEERGQFVFEQDDPGVSFYMVFCGQVEIICRASQDSDALKPTSKENKPSHVAFLNPGDTFGERALLYDSDRRAASARIATNRTELIYINRLVFTDLIQESAESGGTHLEISKRFRSNKDIIRNIFMRGSSQRSEKDLKFAVEYLKSVKFFSRFSFEVRKQLCKVMRLLSAVTNTVLFEEGQEGRHFYIIFSGNVEISVRSKNRFDGMSGSVVSRLGEGESFGELALSDAGGLRRATVTCIDFCEVLVLSRDQYEPLIQKYQNEYHAQYAQMLRKNPYFTGPEWDDNTIEGMCSVMAEKYFSFRSEICKQGSRASEMFVITRGECIMVHEGKHPVTGLSQKFELGRYGPNSVLSCAEASAGNFTDIMIRDYSIVAESPVKVLILSRFDIFHLMSAEARASLQRSSSSYLRESFESRALKTAAWERYRREFLTEFLAAKQNRCVGDKSGTTRLTKTNSTPVLTSEKGNMLEPLIAPGSILLQKRRTRQGGRLVTHRVHRLKKTISNSNDASELSCASKSDSVTSSMVSDDDILQPSHDASEAIDQRQKRSSSTDLSRRRSSLNSECLSLSVDRLQISSPQGCDSDLTEGSPMNADEIQHDESTQQDGVTQDMERKRSISRRLKKSRTLASLNVNGGDTCELTPQISVCEQPLSSPMIGTGVNPGPNCLTKQLSFISPKQPTALASVTPLWNPVHGVAQPFSVLGFMREMPKPKTAPLKGKRAVPGSAQKPTLMSEQSATQLNMTARCDPIITAFRVFGKFRDLHEALDLFGQVCTVETVPAAEKDTSSFAIYKEDEMTMALENYFSGANSELTEAVASTVQTGNPVVPLNSPYQFRALDLPQPNGQRYACVSVAVESPPRVIENVNVHVYQCFPTPQSSVRFAKQMSNTSMAAMTLYVVPLFEWVSIADLERFDAKSVDLEQALESTTTIGSTVSRLSTWKARKEAVKRTRLHVLRTR